MSAPAAPLTRTFSAPFPAVAIAADLIVAVCRAPFAGVLSAASYVARAAITGANTDSRTVNIHNRGQDGLGTTAMATKAFVNAVNAVAHDETTLTLSGTPANLVVAQGDIITVQSLHVGSTGLADPGGTVFLTFTRS